MAHWASALWWVYCGLPAVYLRPSTGAVNRAWHIPRERPFYVAKPRQLVLAIAVATLFLLSALTTLAIEVLADPSRDLGIPGQNFFRGMGVGEPALWVVPWAASFSIFILLYRFAPDCKTYWRYVWTGAVVAAVLFEIGKGLFVWYLENVARYTQVYGSVASVIVLLTWIYLSSMILILGAEVSSEYSRARLRRQGHSASGVFSMLNEEGPHDSPPPSFNGRQSGSPAEEEEPAHPQGGGRLTGRRRLPGLEVPEVPHLADHVHLVDGFGGPAHQVDPVLEMGLFDRFAFRNQLAVRQVAVYLEDRRPPVWAPLGNTVKFLLEIPLR